MAEQRTFLWDPDEPERDDDDMEHQFKLSRVLEKTVFRIGQSHDGPAKTVQCVRCGGTEFNVGKGSYYTAIRCVTCKWELCIHEG